MIKQIVVGALATNCYLYSHDGRNCVIIDPGGDEDKIVRQIESLGLNPMGIAFTHGHIDHTAASGNLQKYYLNKENRLLKVAIHRGDSSRIGLGSESVNKKDLEYIGLICTNISMEKFLPPLPEADVMLEEGGNVFNTDLTILETPGHSEGGVCFFSPDKRILFSGDTLFAQGVGRTDIRGGNGSLLIGNIREKLLILPPETAVYPGHGPPTTIEQELGSNPFL